MLAEIRRDPLGILAGAVVLLAAWATLAVLLEMIG